MFLKDVKLIYNEHMSKTKGGDIMPGGDGTGPFGNGVYGRRNFGANRVRNWNGCRYNFDGMYQRNIYEPTKEDVKEEISILNERINLLSKKLDENS